MEVEWGNRVTCGLDDVARTICIQVSLFTSESQWNDTWS